MADVTLGDLCKAIAQELQARGIVITNKVTGCVVRTGEDVFNFSSRGELFHIYEWYAILFPDRVSADGCIKLPGEKVEMIDAQMAERAERKG